MAFPGTPQTSQPDRYKILSELLPDRLTGQSSIFTSLEGVQQVAQPQTDYFASLALPSRAHQQPRSRAVSSAASNVPESLRPGSSLSFQGLSNQPSNYEAFYQGQEDEESVADTLSEWGLDHLFEDTGARGKSHARSVSGGSLAASVALYQRSTTPAGIPPDASEDAHWQEEDEDDASVRFQAVNFDGRGKGQPRVRKISTTSVLTTQSYTGFSRPVTPVSAPPSRPSSALSRFDPGPTVFESAQEYAERQESMRLRPKFYVEGDHRPSVLVMPEPLATSEDQVREQAMEAERRWEHRGEVCSIPSLRSSDDEGSDQEDQEWEQGDEQKSKETELEELAVSRVPAGKLYGRSLMDELAVRQANMKNKSRAYGGHEGRIKMMEDAAAEQSSSNRRIEDIEPWNRFSVANFQTLMQPSGSSMSLPQQPQCPSQSHLPQTRSVFGVDKVMQAELAKLEKILKIEEAEKKMAAERARVEELERQARQVHKAEKERKRDEKERLKAEKKKKWKKSRMMDDVVLPDDASVLSDPSVVQVQMGAEPASSPRRSEEAEKEAEEVIAEPYRRPPSAAPSLTLSHLDLNNNDTGGGLGAFLKPSAGDSSDDEEDPWAVAENPDRPSQDFEMPASSAQVWKGHGKHHNNSLPKFAFDEEESDSEPEVQPIRGGDSSDDDDKPLNRVLVKSQSAPAQPSRPRTRTKSDVGSLLGLGPDLFQNQSKGSSSSSSDSDEEELVTPQKRLPQATPRAPSSMGFGARQDQESDSEDDVPLGQRGQPSWTQSSVQKFMEEEEDEDDAPLARRPVPQAANDSSDEDVPLGARHSDMGADNMALGSRYPGFAYQQAVQQAQAAEQAAYQQQAAYMAAQQQQAAYHMAMQQQQIMYQSLMVQQQQQQWAMMQQQQADGSILGVTAHPASNDKLARRVDDWRAGVE